MRIPKPFYRKQTQSGYIQQGKKQINLGKDQALAQQKYHELMAGRQEPSPDVTAAVVIDTFLNWCKVNREPRTYEFCHDHLPSFVDFIGKGIRAADVKPLHFTQWLATRNGGDTFKYGAVGAVKRAFEHYADECDLPLFSVSKCKQPRPQAREVYLSPQQWQLVIEQAKPRRLDGTISAWRWPVAQKRHLICGRMFSILRARAESAAPQAWMSGDELIDGPYAHGF